MRLADPAIPLSLERFRLIRDMINHRFGIHFTDDDKYLVESRLSERLAFLDLDSFDDYYHYIKYNPAGDAELEKGTEILTTNETYFFREQYQLRAFSDELLPTLHQKNAGRKRLMIWSAGCSSGEEVYTIAMLIINSGLFNGWDVRVFGSDISSRMLAKARKGVFSKSAFRSTPESEKKKHFTKTDSGWRINENVRSLCHFGRLNILDKERIIFVGRVDVVFCRNVLIYFDKRSKTEGISVLYDRLNPGGYLLLGHTESLINLSTAFELVHLKEDLVYRRPEINHG